MSSATAARWAGWWRVAVLGSGYLGTQVVWTLYNAYLPNFYGAYVASNALIGLVMTLDNIAALTVQPYFGALSDRVQTPLGRRMPFLLIGVPLTALGLVLLPRAQGLLPLLLATLLMNVGISIYSSPAVALMPDVTPPALRARANGIIMVMGGLGALLAIFVLSPSFDRSRVLPFDQAALLVLASLLAVALALPERRLARYAVGEGTRPADGHGGMTGGTDGTAPGGPEPASPRPSNEPAPAGPAPAVPGGPAPAAQTPRAPDTPAQVVPEPGDPHRPAQPAPGPGDPHIPAHAAPEPGDPHIPAQTVPEPRDPDAPAVAASRWTATEGATRTVPEPAPSGAIAGAAWQPAADEPARAAREGTEAEEPAERGHLLLALAHVLVDRDRRPFWLLLAALAWVAAVNGAQNMFTRYGTEHLGLTQVQATFMLGYFAAPFILFSIPAGILGDRIGRLRAIRIGAAGIVLAFLALAFEPPGAVAPVLFAVAGLCWALLMTNSYPILINLAPVGTAGTYTGLWNLVIGLAGVLSPPVYGAAVDRLGWAAFFPVGVAFLAVGWWAANRMGAAGAGGGSALP